MKMTLKTSNKNTHIIERTLRNELLIKLVKRALHQNLKKKNQEELQPFISDFIGIFILRYSRNSVSQIPLVVLWLLP